MNHDDNDMTIDQRIAYNRWKAAQHRQKAGLERTPRMERQKHLDDAEACDSIADELLCSIDQQQHAAQDRPQADPYDPPGL